MPTTTTTIPTKNLFFDILNGYNIKNATSVTVLFSTLSKGVASSQCRVSCPSCESIYFFGNLNAYNNFISLEFTDLESGDALPCCGRSAGLVTTLSNPFTGICNTQFEPCLQTLENIIGSNNYQSLLNLGIIEYSSINNRSIICDLIAEMQNSPIYNPALLYNVFAYILTEGLILTCDTKFSIAGTLDTYAQYLEAFNQSVPA
jgi:hypothetical protein